MVTVAGENGHPADPVTEVEEVTVEPGSLPPPEPAEEPPMRSRDRDDDEEAEDRNGPSRETRDKGLRGSSRRPSSRERSPRRRRHPEPERRRASDKAAKADSAEGDRKTYCEVCGQTTLGGKLGYDMHCETSKFHKKWLYYRQGLPWNQAEARAHKDWVKQKEWPEEADSGRQRPFALSRAPERTSRGREPRAPSKPPPGPKLRLEEATRSGGHRRRRSTSSRGRRSRRTSAREVRRTRSRSPARDRRETARKPREASKKPQTTKPAEADKKKASAGTKKTPPKKSSSESEEESEKKTTDNDDEDEEGSESSSTKAAPASSSKLPAKPSKPPSKSVAAKSGAKATKSTPGAARSEPVGKHPAEARLQAVLGFYEAQTALLKTGLSSGSAL